MKTHQLAVVSVHRDPSNPRALDLKHIFSALDINVIVPGESVHHCDHRRG
jgi:hypothetical protein